MSSRKQRRTRGRALSLVEVLITVAIIAVVSAGIAFAAFASAERAKTKQTETNLQNLFHQVEAWRSMANTDACPTLANLVDAGLLSEASSRTDPWGREYSVECDGARHRVISTGPDRKAGTDDDLFLPRAR